MERETISLRGYEEKLRQDPFNFGGDNYLIVPERLVGSEIFKGIDFEGHSRTHSERIPQIEDVESVPYVSNMDLRRAFMFNMKIGSVFNSSLWELFGNSKIESLTGMSSVFALRGNSKVDYMTDSSKLWQMKENSSVRCMRGQSRVNTMYDSSSVHEMFDFSRVGGMLHNTRVNHMNDSSRISIMEGSAQVGRAGYSSRIGRMKDSSTVRYLSENAGVESLEDQAKVIEVLDFSNPKTLAKALTGVFEGIIKRR